MRHVQVNSNDDILNAKKLLFPGVGSYGQAMNELQKQGYVDALTEYIQVRTTTYRICNTILYHVLVEMGWVCQSIVFCGRYSTL